MKARQNVSGFQNVSGYSESPIFVNVIIAFEFLWAFWLSLNFYERQSRFVSAAVFAIFACVSFTKALAGEKTCGCFGNLTVPPVFTACLDVVVAFLSARSVLSDSSVKGKTLASNVVRIIFFGIIFLLFGSAAVPQKESETVVPLLSRGQIIPTASWVSADPERWLNKDFPLSPYCEKGDSLDSDHWLVLLYNPECGVCQDALVQTRRFARQKQIRFAVVNVNRQSSNAAEPDAEYVGALSEDFKWLVNVPCALEVDSGTVTRLYKNPSEIPLFQERARQ